MQDLIRLLLGTLCDCDAGSAGGWITAYVVALGIAYEICLQKFAPRD